MTMTKQQSESKIERPGTYDTWQVGKGSRYNYAGWVVYRRGDTRLEDSVFQSYRAACAEAARLNARDPWF